MACCSIFLTAGPQRKQVKLNTLCIAFHNLTGTPSLSVPMGLCSNGLPAGMQLIGNYLSEKQLLQVGHAWERTNPLSFRISN